MADLKLSETAVYSGFLIFVYSSSRNTRDFSREIRAQWKALTRRARRGRNAEAFLNPLRHTGPSPKNRYDLVSAAIPLTAGSSFSKGLSNLKIQVKRSNM